MTTYYVVTVAGVVHSKACQYIKPGGNWWPWRPADAIESDRACARCLVYGMPKEEL